MAYRLAREPSKLERGVRFSLGSLLRLAYHFGGVGDIGLDPLHGQVVTFVACPLIAAGLTAHHDNGKEIIYESPWLSGTATAC